MEKVINIFRSFYKDTEMLMKGVFYLKTSKWQKTVLRGNFIAISLSLFKRDMEDFFYKWGGGVSIIPLTGLTDNLVLMYMKDRAIFDDSFTKNINY